MKYFKHNKTGEVFAYEQSDLDTVERINQLEIDLAQTKAILDSLSASSEFVPEYDDEGNITNANEDYKQAYQNMIDIQAELESIFPVFYDIRELLKNTSRMLEEEVEEYINPVPTPEQLAEAARSKRDALLQELDIIVSNPLRWTELDDDTKQTLAEYRQALLDVPQQEGFPDNIEWPEMPEV